MTKVVNTLLTDEQYERLRTAAFETRRSQADIIREALDQWLELYVEPKEDKS